MIAHRAFSERTRGRRAQGARLGAWSVVSNPLDVEALQAIAYSPTLDLWCACGNDGYLITAPGNGVVWTQRSTAFLGFVPVLYRVVWSGTHFVATGSSPGQAQITVIRSADGVNWAQVNTAAVIALGLACEGMATNGAGQLIIGGQYTGTPAQGSILARSTDHGATWGRVGNPNTGDVDVFECAWTGQDWIATGALVGGRPKILTSPDGLAWTSRTAAAPVTGISGLCVNAGAGRIVLGGRDPITSDDRGVSWSGPHPTPLEVGSALRFVLYTGRQWIGVSASTNLRGNVLTSRDGRGWAKLRTTESAAFPLQGFFGLERRASDGFLIGVGARTGAGSLIARMGGLQ